VWAESCDARGYWIINADGEIANFNAPSYGSVTGTKEAPSGIAGY
jgi:hypothetical protein